MLLDIETLSPRVRVVLRTLLGQGHAVHVIKPAGRLRTQAPAGMGPNYRESFINAGGVAGPRMLAMLPLLYARTLRALRGEPADVIHCAHLFQLPIGLMLARAKRASLVYDAYDWHSVNWSSYAPPALRPHVRRLIEAVENRLVARSDCVFTVDSVGQALERRYRSFNPDVAVLYNVPPRHVPIAPAKIEELRRRFQDSELVAYAGGIQEVKGFSVTLRAMELVRRQFPRARLLMIGVVNDASGRVKLDECNGLIEYVNFLPYEEMLPYLCVSRVGLALYQPAVHFGMVGKGTARKLFTYMQASLPIVASDFGEISAIVREEGCGVLVDPTDPQRIAGAIIDFLAKPELAAAMGRAGARAIDEKYNWDIESSKLTALYPKAPANGAAQATPHSGGREGNRS
jgi:glycosyltransferase involved in cell wall biosynthesis